jgi:hypothetical protein
MKILVCVPYGFKSLSYNTDYTSSFLPRVGEYILCTLNTDGLRDYPNRSVMDNQIELIVDRVSHDLVSGEVIIDVIKN